MANLQELTKENNIWQTIRSLPILPIATIVLLLFVGIFAPLISPYPPLDGDLDLRNANPSWLGDTDSPYFLGGDHIGRDILTRIIYGTRIWDFGGNGVGIVVGLHRGVIGRIHNALGRFYVRCSIYFSCSSVRCFVVSKPYVGNYFTVYIYMASICETSQS